MGDASDTRRRIKREAVELFAEQGYDATSLRQIAERLGVTKAALYYHFKTKEDIALGFFEDYGAAVDELIEWGEGRPRTIGTRRELLARYADLLETHVPAMRFVHENRPAMRKLDKEAVFQERLRRLNRILVDEDAPLLHRLRGFDALMSMHGGWFVHHTEDPDELREATVAIAVELIESNESDRSTSTAPASREAGT